MNYADAGDGSRLPPGGGGLSKTPIPAKQTGNG